MVRGPSKMNKRLVGRVRVFKLGWSMTMGPLKRNKTLVGRVRVSKWGWSMRRVPLKRKNYGWEGQSA